MDEQIAEKALSLLCEDDLLKRLADESTFPSLESLLRSVEKTSWSDGVKEQCKKVREVMDTTVIVLSAVCYTMTFLFSEQRCISFLNSPRSLAIILSVNIFRGNCPFPKLAKNAPSDLAVFRTQRRCAGGRR